MTGEHVYPWIFEELTGLAPMREAAHLLAGYQWPHLYDPKALATNDVPAAGAIYAEDMYVERTFSEETVRPARIGIWTLRWTPRMTRRPYGCLSSAATGWNPTGVRSGSSSPHRASGGSTCTRSSSTRAATGARRTWTAVTSTTRRVPSTKVCSMA